MTWEKYKEEIILNLSVNEIYGHLENQKPSGSNWVSCKCPFHADGKINSFQFNAVTLQMKCFSGCEGNSVFDFLIKQTGKSFKELLFELGDRFSIERPVGGHQSEKEPPTNKRKGVQKKTDNNPAKTKIQDDDKPLITEELVKYYQEQMCPEIITAFADRLITEETIKKYQIGASLKRKRITIPIRDAKGKLVNIRLYDPNSDVKMINYTTLKKEPKDKDDKWRYGSPVRLFGADELSKYDGSQVIVCGGEWDRLLLQQNGFMAVTATGGEGSFKKEWFKLFKGKDIAIILDCDEPGKLAAKKITNMFLADKDNYKSIKNVLLLLAGTKKENDITDWFTTNHTAKALQKLIDDAPIQTEGVSRELEWFVFPSGVKLNYVPAKLAQKILSENHFSYEAEEIFFYKDGYYQGKGKDFVLNQTIKHLGDEYSTRRANEVLFYITQQAKTFPPLDEEYTYINVANGLIQDNGACDYSLLVHTPEYKTKIQLPIKYDPNAKCPTIERFFNQILPEDCLDLVYEIFGYVLVPEACYEKSFMLLGEEGQNGKSTFLNLLKKFIGRRNYSTISLQDLITDKFRPARLRGKLANIHADLSGQMLENNDVFKAMVSGDDIDVEEKFKNAYSFENFARLFFSTNKLPRSRDVTNAFYRRWIILIFSKYITDSEKDLDLAAKLTTSEELSGLLNKALVAQNNLFNRNSFISPESTKKALSVYQTENDNVLEFIQTECLIDTNYTVVKEALFANYKEWCGRSGYRNKGKKDFNKGLLHYVGKEKIREKRNSQYERKPFWKGIGLCYENIQ